jgi:hypothetical protein
MANLKNTIINGNLQVSGNIAGNLQGNADTATNSTYSKIALTNPSSGTWYYPTWVTEKTNNSNCKHNVNDGLRYFSLEGTESANGRAIMSLGNSTASGTAGNKYGAIRIYSGNTGYIDLKASDTTSNTTHTFPSTGGTILNSGTTSFTQSLTSGTKIGSIKIDDITTSLYCQTNTNTTYTFATGDSNGQIKVTPSDGSASNISVKGLSTAAYRGVTTASSKTHTNYGTNGTYVPAMDFLSYWNGAYSSSNVSNLTYAHQGTIQCKPTSLYDNSSGTSGTVTLSSSAANFTFIEIFYKESQDSTMYNSATVYSPNGKLVDLMITIEGSSRVYFVGTKCTISGTTLSFTNNRRIYFDNGSTAVFDNGAEIKVTKVVGYK